MGVIVYDLQNCVLVLVSTSTEAGPLFAGLGEMASSFILPHCSVCKRSLIYDNDVPYLLPCLHSVCKGCVSKDSHAVFCSHCCESFNKREYIFLEDRVTQDDLFASTLKNHPSEIKCTNKTHENVATVWCKDCQLFFCKDCKLSHNQVKSSQSHEIVILKGFDLKGTLQRRSRCPEHGTYYLDLYDVTCEILVCSKCARTDHKQCQHEEISGTESEDKNNLQKGQENLDKKLQVIISSLEDINKAKIKTDTKNKSVKQGLAHQFDQLRALITRREKELMKVLQNRQNKVNMEINRVNSKLERTAEKVQVALDYTKKFLDKDDPEGYLTLKNTVKARMEVCLVEEVESLNVARLTVAFDKEKIDEVATLMSSIGEVESVDEGDGSFSGTYENTEIDAIQTKTADSSVAPTKKTSTSSLVNSSDMTDCPLYGNYENIDEDGGGNPNKDSGEDECPLYSDCVQVDVPACPKLIFDIERVNPNKAHVDNAGFLVNIPLPTEKMYSQYVGTTAVISIPKTEHSYWEVETDIQIDKEIQSSGLLMEIGVMEGDKLDEQYCASGQSKARCLTVVHCSTHKVICVKVWNRGSKKACIEDVILNKAGEFFKLKHGIQYNGKRKTLAFFDLNKMKLVDVLAIDCGSDDVWPVFGVYNPRLASVKMRVVSGADVDLTDEKLILFEETKSEFV